jgi:hypothetical protein
MSACAGLQDNVQKLAITVTQNLSWLPKLTVIDDLDLSIPWNLLKTEEPSKIPAYRVPDRELQPWLWSLLFRRMAQLACRNFVLSDATGTGTP